LVAFSEFEYLKVTNIIVIDNLFGVTLMSSASETNHNDLFDSIIVGETDSFDSICEDKYGLHLSTNSWGQGKKHIIKRPELPWHKIKDETSFSATFYAENVTF